MRFFKEDDFHYNYIIIDCKFSNLESLLIENGGKKIEINESIFNFDFAKEYIEFIGTLNVEYNSLFWWANSISSKNPLSSQLIPNIRNYYLIISTLKRKDIDNIIIISSNYELNYSIKLFCNKNSFDYKILNNKQCILFDYFKRAGENIIRGLYFVLNGWWKKFLVSKYLKKKIENDIRGVSSFYVLRTWLDSRSFPSLGEYKDAYFGVLPQYLTKKGIKLIILAEVLKNFNDVIHRILNYNELLIIPQEYFIGYFDYINILILTYQRKIKIKNKILFNGEDVTYLIESQLKKDSVEIEKNLQYYYYIKGLSKQIDINIFTYTFENHSWEKVSILALRKYSPVAKIFGYQHAQVPKYLLNFFPGETERDIIPMPNKIITTGKETKKILETYGNYNPDIIKEGCALRHQYLYEMEKIIKKNRSYNILVPLGMLDDSVKLINFLNKSPINMSKYNLILRCHPIVNFETIKKRLYFNPEEKFIVSRIANIKEDLRSADIVIYTGTTVCIEALMMGIPVIHIDLEEPITIDPLFRMNDLKWVATKEEELPMIIEYINALGGSELLELQDKARKTIQDYLSEVNEDKLKEFIE